MRWFKHLTDTPNDEKIARLISKHGHAGYGLLWLVMEVVAKSMDGTDKCSVTYPISHWSHLLSLRGSHVISSLSKLNVTGVVTMVRHGNEVTVTITNLLKYRDEYSSKSGQTHDSVRSKKQKQNTEAEAEAEAPPPRRAGSGDMRSPSAAETSVLSHNREEYYQPKRLRGNQLPDLD